MFVSGQKMFHGYGSLTPILSRLSTSSDLSPALFYSSKHPSGMANSRSLSLTDSFPL